MSSIRTAVVHLTNSDADELMTKAKTTVLKNAVEAAINAYLKKVVG